MTNELSVEEAIELLKEKRMEINYQVNGTTRFSKALEMAIKALEQETCEDAVSREAVKEMLTEEWTKYMPMEADVNLSFVLEKISELPSVTPKAESEE